jgi:hypothetical protein
LEARSSATHQPDAIKFNAATFLTKELVSQPEAFIK